jgi:hypothetical protein
MLAGIEAARVELGAKNKGVSSMYSLYRQLTLALPLGTICGVLVSVGCDFSEEGKTKEAPIPQQQQCCRGSSR